MNNQICNRNIRLLNIFTMCVNAVFCLPIIHRFLSGSTGLTFHDFWWLDQYSARLLLFSMCRQDGWLILSDEENSHCRSINIRFWVMAYYSGNRFLDCRSCRIYCRADHHWWTVTKLGHALRLFTRREWQDEFRNAKVPLRHAIYSCSAASVIGGYLYVMSPTYPMEVHSAIVVLAAIAALFLSNRLAIKNYRRKSASGYLKDCQIYNPRSQRNCRADLADDACIFNYENIHVWRPSLYLCFRLSWIMEWLDCQHPHAGRWNLRTYRA